MASRSAASLESLLQGSAPLWRGRQRARVRARSTGFESLDQQLPGGGWPLGALTEILPACEGLGELSLVLPALRSLSEEGRPVVLVRPPHVPYAPALARAGLLLKLVLWVEAPRDEEGRWAAEQLLREGAAVLVWSGTREDRSLRRLQLAAESGGALAFLFRSQHALADPSPAALRLALYPHERGVCANLVKVRGGHTAQLTLRLSGPFA
jgi:protein ImuA